MTAPDLAWLAELPGRCPRCYWHIGSMGHKNTCRDSSEPHRRAEAGMSRAEAARPGDVELVDRAIREACAKGEPFSANNFRHLVEQVEQPAVIGARIRAAVNGKRIKRVGDEPSTLVGTHGHRIGKYVAAP